MWRSLFWLLSPPGGNARLSVLFFHRVREHPDPLLPGQTTAEPFERRMRWLCSRFRMLQLGEAVQRLARRSLPARAMCVTFDDGYADNLTVALPIMQRLGIPFTVFVCTGVLDGGARWNDRVIEAVRAARGQSLALGWLGLGDLPVDAQAARRHALGLILERLKYLPPAPRLACVQRLEDECGVRGHPSLMLDTAQLRRLAAAGVEIGAHTVTHPILAQLPADAARQEICQSKADLEARLARPVELFAYPNGRPLLDYREEHVDMVRNAGFRAAFSTADGVCHARSDPLQLPRYTPWGRTHARYGMRLAQNLARLHAAHA